MTSGSGSLWERLVLLAAVALLGSVVALAVGEKRAENAAAEIVASAPAAGGWNQAFAGSRGPVGDAQRTTCGQVLTAESLGVTHPVLPCGAKLIVRRNGTQILTEVIDNKIMEPGRQFEVTEGLAAMLELEGTEEIEWRFATGTSG
jgi:hypothetical protein